MNPLERAQAELKVLTEEVEGLAAKDELTAEENERFQSLTVGGEFDAVKQRVAALEERESKVASILKDASRSVLTAEAGADFSSGRSKPKRDPYDFSEVRTGPEGIPEKEYVERAYDAIEQAPEYVPDAAREAAALRMKQSRDGMGAVAQHYLKYGSPEYTEAWFHYISTGEKRAVSTTGANGGYMIPFHLDPSVVLTNAGAVNPFRDICKVVTITSNVYHGVSSAGVTVEWTSEGSEWTDKSPTFVQPTISTYKANAWVPASYEVIRSAPNLAQEVASMFADAKNNEEASVFATGNGTTQPEGIVTRLSVTTASKVSATTNGTFGIPDVFALINNLPARHQANASWLGHWAIFNLARQFGVGSVGQGAFWTDLGNGTPPQLAGAPVYKSSAMTSSLSSATASTDYTLILGDFAKYTIVDVIGTETIYVPAVMGPNSRPTGQAGWGMYWSVGGDTVDSNAFRVLVN